MLRVRVLGPIRVELDGRAIEPPASRRAWSLLAYLAIHPGPHRRGDVAARFWPDVLDSSARQSLRSAVWALRRALGPGERLLATTREEISLDRTNGLWVDAFEFERLLAAGEPPAADDAAGGRRRSQRRAVGVRATARAVAPRARRGAGGAHTGAGP